MKTFSRLLVTTVAFSVVMLSGCANVTSGSLHAPLNEWPSEICIIENPKVKISAALPAMQEAFARRNIKTEVCSNVQDCKSPWRLEYVMRRSWDVTTYLGSGQMTLRKDGRIVSTSSYEAGDFSFNKWGKTDERIDGMVAKLLGE